MPKIISQKWKESSVKKFQAVEELRIQDKFCDVTLQSVDEVNVRAHKIILISGSKYFYDLLSSETKETCQDFIKYEFKGDVLEKVISFMYTGELNISAPERIKEIAICANCFKLTELIDECMKLITESLDNDNCLKYWRLAHECFHRESEDRCISYVINVLNRIYDCESFFNQLNKDELEILITDARLLWSEEKKFEKLLQLTKRNTTSKKEFNTIFSQFIEFIDFTSISKNILPIILCDDEIVQHKNILAVIGSKCKETVTNPQKKLLAIIDFELITISDFGEFTGLQYKKHRVEYSADTTFNNFLFVCGGKNDNDETDNVCEYFDPEKKKWYELPFMPTPRFYHACTFLEDKIYVCGGCNNGILSTVEIFNIKQDKWTLGQSMKTARYRFGLTSTNRALYAVSGDSGKNIEMFDPRTTNGWKEVYSSFQDYGYTQCASVGNDIYCFQSKDNGATVFDTKMNKMREWKGVHNYASPGNGYAFKVCELNGHFNFIQRNRNNRSLIDFYKYDFKGNSVCSKPKVFSLPVGGIEALVALNF